MLFFQTGRMRDEECWAEKPVLSKLPVKIDTLKACKPQVTFKYFNNRDDFFKYLKCLGTTNSVVMNELNKRKLFTSDVDRDTVAPEDDLLQAQDNVSVWENFMPTGFEPTNQDSFSFTPKRRSRLSLGSKKLADRMSKAVEDKFSRSESKQDDQLLTKKLTPGPYVVKFISNYDEGKIDLGIFLIYF